MSASRCRPCDKYFIPFITLVLENKHCLRQVRLHSIAISKKIAFFEKVVKKNRRQNPLWRRFLTLSVYNFFTRISVLNFAAELAEKRGREAGMAEGLARGREEGKRVTAMNLKSLGVDVHTIAKATGMSVEIIDSL